VLGCRSAGGTRLERLQTSSVGGFAGDEEHSLRLVDQAVALEGPPACGAGYVTFR
jgi:hypothetical protein